MEIPDYSQLEQLLQAASAPIGAAEAQGLLLGLICARDDRVLQRWLEEVLADCELSDLLVAECRTGLEVIYGSTVGALTGPGLGVHPMLPADEHPLAERSGALASWCQGFLYGLGLGRIDEERLSAVSREAMQDLARMAALAGGSEQGDEAEAAALEELIEFAWVAHLLICEDLAQELAPPL